MKGLCVSESSGDYVFQFQGDSPNLGEYYELDSAVTGTLAQNKLFHALITEYWKSGLHPTLGGEPWATLRKWIKDKLGEGKTAYRYVYIDESGKLVVDECKKYEEIPSIVIEGLSTGIADAFGKLKSWSDYTKKQRLKCIDNLILDMTAAGVNSKKFNEIMEGIKSDSK